MGRNKLKREYNSFGTVTEECALYSSGTKVKMSKVALEEEIIRPRGNFWSRHYKLTF